LSGRFSVYRNWCQSGRTASGSLLCL
jgi:hypothetical protein